MGEMNGPSEMVDTERFSAADYAFALALAALIFAHLAFWAATMAALPAALIFRFLGCLVAGMEAVAVAVE